MSFYTEFLLMDSVCADFAPNPYSLVSWLVYATVLYSAGLLGVVFNYNNFIITMLAVELMYLGVITSFVVCGLAFQRLECLVYGLLLLILAACESALGLGILIVLYRFERSIDLHTYQTLGG
jgi:NADH-quinone oxidoreductase subunit K